MYASFVPDQFTPLSSLKPGQFYRKPRGTQRYIVVSRDSVLQNIGDGRGHSVNPYGIICLGQHHGIRLQSRQLSNIQPWQRRRANNKAIFSVSLAGYLYYDFTDILVVEAPAPYDWSGLDRGPTFWERLDLDLI